MTETEESPAPPLLRVVRGGVPTAEELAALVAAVSLATSPDAGPAGDAGSSGSRWAARRSALRPMPRPGPGAWAASSRPH